MQIIIADDHKLVRDGLRPFLLEVDVGAEILEASNLDEAVAQARQASSLGLVLLDLMMPGMNTLGGLEVMRSVCPTVPVVIISGYSSRDHVISAIQAGASGFIPKTVSGSTMVSALKLVLSGEKYLPSSSFLEPQSQQIPMNHGNGNGNGPFNRLTRREIEVLDLTVRGGTNKEIANGLGLKEITVKVHLRNIYRKIGANNRAQAVRLAMSAGFDGNGAS